jgi:hypothetical protein
MHPRNVVVADRISQESRHWWRRLIEGRQSVLWIEWVRLAVRVRQQSLNARFRAIDVINTHDYDRKLSWIITGIWPGAIDVIRVE